VRSHAAICSELHFGSSFGGHFGAELGVVQQSSSADAAQPLPSPCMRQVRVIHATVMGKGVAAQLSADR
jgi:hypothetical protein